MVILFSLYFFGSHLIVLRAYSCQSPNPMNRAGGRGLRKDRHNIEKHGVQGASSLMEKPTNYPPVSYLLFSVNQNGRKGRLW